MNNKEKEFIKEYKELLRKHNVSLVEELWSDEYGEHVNTSFKETGKYCNINYVPDVKNINLGRRGMGR